MSGLAGHHLGSVETSQGGVNQQQKKRSETRTGSEGRAEQREMKEQDCGRSRRKPQGPVLMWNHEAVLCRRL